MDKCKWIYKKSLLLTQLMPSCDKFVMWWDEYTMDRCKFKFCPYCGKEIIKTEIIKFDGEY